MTTCKQCQNYGHHQMECRSKCWVCNNTGHIGNNCAMNKSSTPARPVQQRLNPPAQSSSHMAVSSGVGYNQYGQLVRRTVYVPVSPGGVYGQLRVPQPMVYQGSGINPMVFGLF